VGEEPPYLLVGDWVGPRAGLETFGNKRNFLFLCGKELRFLDLPKDKLSHTYKKNA
jgi:hypothetical protein